MLYAKEKSLIGLIANFIGCQPAVLVNNLSDSDSVFTIYVMHYFLYLIDILIFLSSINQQQTYTLILGPHFF